MKFKPLTTVNNKKKKQQQRIRLILKQTKVYKRFPYFFSTSNSNNLSCIHNVMGTSMKKRSSLRTMLINILD